MAKAIMIQGTMSNVGKSLITAGLGRVLMQDGWKVAPFKSQNMALNSWITDEGLEMGRAQVVQAQACGIKPSVLMNPILLKPTTDRNSQVIVNGEVRGVMTATEYFVSKPTLLPEALAAYEKLSAQYDVIVVEGAGSPAEINLRDRDIVNMGIAKHIRAPVLLVGDIDRGGVFAQLCGTLMLLEDDEKALIKALVINKFRGDIDILKPGLTMLEEKAGKPVAGTIPFLDVDIEEEDNFAGRAAASAARQGADLDIAVIRLPRISNFTDLYALEATNGIAVRYVGRTRELGRPDAIILPGTKNTIADLLWIRENGLEAAVLQQATKGTMIFGICGGYQMLGKKVTDSEGVEISGGASVAGMGLLPVETTFHPEKHRKQVNGRTNAFGGCAVEGYEIHMGQTKQTDESAHIDARDHIVQNGAVYGTYLHGVFDNAQCREAFCAELCARKSIPPLAEHHSNLAHYKETQYNKLASAIRTNLDMNLVRKILEEGI
ncbi:MAG: cobyric acid synthase [Spirochaetaceae bacterium]|jgi:adenosylcobyric acid synthase|nr:cobyric acid synthase [Spirochaetaceae bacterium]